jgi:DNA-binding ferritin-like protein (Dps family)
MGLARHSVAIHDKAIVEAFPSSFLGVMIEEPGALVVERSDRSDTFFQHLASIGLFHRLVEHHLPGRMLPVHPSTITNHDDRAAFVCALTALCIAAGEFIAVGDEDGWIILPPCTFTQPWALEALKANTAQDSPQALRLEPSQALHIKEPSPYHAGLATGRPSQDTHMKEWIAVLKAADAAARWHVHQKRKGAAQEPYINHLLEVASLVAEATHGSDPDLVVAALLHDAIEDQEVPREMIAEVFGDDVATLVEECTDDKSLAKQEQKRLQVVHAPEKSPRAKVIKLADKTSNLRTISASPSPNWSVKRRLEYVTWAREVAAGLRGTNEWLEDQFDRAAAMAIQSVSPER